MRIAEVVGRLTCSRTHPSLPRGRFLITRPLPLTALRQGSADRADDVVVFDELGAGPGALIGLSEGAEAANPFGSPKPPIDAYCACLIDSLSIS